MYNDNDIGGTEFTIGFDTALNTIVERRTSCDTSNSHRRCSLIEVMGRNCGDIAVWTSIACGAEVCITKETGFDLRSSAGEYKKAAKHKRHAIVIVAENIVDIEELAKTITKKTPLKPGLRFRPCTKGGKPTVRDRVLASEMGVKAVEALIAGDDRHCVASVGNKIVTVPLEEALASSDSTDTLKNLKCLRFMVDNK